mmetsp:Transcript_44970/g.101188  ORF Transcript_44970/g.101188 Transcript_44970/m.101188 type:complete len:233 (+) Transcript_44970:403-1101(+)
MKTPRFTPMKGTLLSNDGTTPLKKPALPVSWKIALPTATIPMGFSDAASLVRTVSSGCPASVVRVAMPQDANRLSDNLGRLGSSHTVARQCSMQAKLNDLDIATFMQLARFPRHRLVTPLRATRDRTCAAKLCSVPSLPVASMTLKRSAGAVTVLVATPAERPANANDAVFHEPLLLLHSEDLWRGITSASGCLRHIRQSNLFSSAFGTESGHDHVGAPSSITATLLSRSFT